MRRLDEILREMRRERICKPLEDDDLNCECHSSSDRRETKCRQWTQENFAEFSDVNVRNYQRWENGQGGFTRGNLERLQKRLQEMPCKRRKRTQPKLQKWEKELFGDLALAIQLGPQPRTTKQSIESEILKTLRGVRGAETALSIHQAEDLNKTIAFLERPSHGWLPYRVGIVSRTISRFEERLRDLNCDAANLLKFSSVIALRSAAQIAISRREHQVTLDRENFDFGKLLKGALKEAEHIIEVKSNILNTDEKVTLQDAVTYFRISIDDPKEMPFDTISLLCDEVYQLATRTEKPDYFREILELLADKATRAEAQTLFADEDGPEMVVMPLPATVEIGTSDHEVYMGNLRDPIPSREQPVINARMNRKFSIGRFPVTVEQYSKFCSEAGRPVLSIRDPNEGAMPAVGVSWYDAKDYCSWLSERTSHLYRLPSEVEWEFACRTISLSDTAFFFGNEISVDDAVFADTELGSAETTRSRRFPPNALGIFFMHGNVWEWCEDAFDEGYDKGRTQVPFEVDAGANRVLRGGSWSDPAHLLRSGSRLDAPPDTTSELVGFRVVRDLSWSAPHAN